MLSRNEKRFFFKHRIEQNPHQKNRFLSRVKRPVPFCNASGHPGWAAHMGV